MFRKLFRKSASVVRFSLGIPVSPFVRPLARSRNNVEPPLTLVRETLCEQEANAYISNLIGTNKPCMIARFGSTEIAACRSLYKDLSLTSLESFYFWTQTGLKPFGLKRYKCLSDFSGFFPICKQSLRKFYAEMETACYQVDLLGSWAEGEAHFLRQLNRTKVCYLKDLEPYYHQKPWSRLLSGKKVLVVHPFSETIKKQYLKRSLLFDDPEVLPGFQLSVMPAVQSIASAHVPYESWHDALNAMTKKSLEFDFDVAIIGCGAYGFPLAARLKRAGKQVIHLGGATQLLFGIKGKRWDNHPILSKLYNEHWVRPSLEETPAKAESVEGACYW